MSTAAAAAAAASSSSSLLSPSQESTSLCTTPPAFRPSVASLRHRLLERTTWRVCKSLGPYAHKVSPADFGPGELLCRACKLADQKCVVEPSQAEAKVRELLALEPCHFIPRYDQPGCGVERDAPTFDSKDWMTWSLKPSSRGTVLRERLWQCCLGGGKKAADRYKTGQAKGNSSKIGCPRSLYAVTRWDGERGQPGLVEIYFKHQHMSECWALSAATAGASNDGQDQQQDQQPAGRTSKRKANDALHDH
ncbi:hypothetical protein RI367_006066 [Sorochytrium milnesiophthora]